MKKRKLFIVVDMQNDFVTGSLGTKEAQAIVPKIIEELKSLDKDDVIVYTKDTHFDDYLETLEGKMLPVKHCVLGTEGWEIVDGLQETRLGLTFKKLTFGSDELGTFIKWRGYDFDEIHFVGLCSDICLISNVLMARMFQSDMKIIVHADMCAGTTPEKHKMALEVMKSCQIEVVGE